jgi:hypothetical protein
MPYRRPPPHSARQRWWRRHHCTVHWRGKTPLLSLPLNRPWTVMIRGYPFGCVTDPPRTRRRSPRR